MKYPALLLLLLIISCQDKEAKKDDFIKAPLKLSKIDSIKTNDDALKYLSAIDSNFTYFHLEKIQELTTLHNPVNDSLMKIIAKKAGIDKNFYKEDFDNNGYNDLLVIGGWAVTSTAFEGEEYAQDYFIIMNFGKKPAKIIPMQKSMHYFTVPEIKSLAGEPVLVVHDPKGIDYKNPKITDTISTKLIYRFGGFVEYNKNPADNHIEKIEFEASGCYGTCPAFELTINKDRSAVFRAEVYNFNKNRESYTGKDEGLFKVKIKEADYNQLTGFLNYLDFKNLEDGYHVTHTDAPTGTLQITYDNGKIKTISDYGMQGTSGLMGVYNLLFELRFNQKWIKQKEQKLP
jgi:hypothetical protein